MFYTSNWREHFQVVKNEDRYFKQTQKMQQLLVLTTLSTSAVLWLIIAYSSLFLYLFISHFIIYYWTQMQCWKNDDDDGRRRKNNKKIVETHSEESKININTCSLARVAPFYEAVIVKCAISCRSEMKKMYFVNIPGRLRSLSLYTIWVATISLPLSLSITLIRLYFMVMPLNT